MNCFLFGLRSLARAGRRPALLSFLFAAWTLVVEGAGWNWQTGPGCRWSELPVPKAGKTGFTLLDGSISGILFTNLLDDEHSLTNRNLLSGSGVAAGDVDGDGLVDLYFCGLDNHNALYRNLGQWKFEDITAGAGVACSNQYSTAAVLADIDGDGDLDLLVNALGGGTRLFLNDGRGHFAESTDSGLIRRQGSMSMALADVDGHGALDLYVANFRPDTIRDEPTTKFHGQIVAGRPVITTVNDQPATLPEYTNRFVLTPSGNVLEFGEPDVLYRNDGNGHFQPRPFTDGSFLDEDGSPLTDPPRDWGLAVQFHDLNGDGAPDIYVCNDLFTPDRVWVNDGHGKFRALPRLALRNTSTFSMGVDFADIDRDGAVDFFVVDMLSRDHQKRHVQVSESNPAPLPVGLIDIRPQVLRNNLQINRGDGTFAEATYYAGLEASEWSWGPIFLDVDLDGFEDILVTTGQLRDFQNIDMANRIDALRAAGKLTRLELLKWMRSYPSLVTAKVIFRNRGDRTFEEKGADWGFNTPGISQGMCLADLDNDGDLDVVMNNLNGAAGVYRNESNAPRVAVRLKGLGANTRGIGAKIWLYGGAVPMQSQEMICGGRYLSSDDAMRVFAAGSVSNEMRLEVRWRSGRRSVVNGVKANRIYEIEEAGAEPASSKLQAPSSKETSNFQLPTSNSETKAVFEDVSGLIGHVHHEEPYNDFERQPLLGRKLSQLGPGVGWYDVDGDGWEDLIVGSGKGGALAVYRNDGRGGFQRMSRAPWTQIATRDQTGVVAWSKGPGQTVILAGSANYEDGLALGASVRQYDVATGTIDDRLPGQLSSTGPVALGDVKGEGQMSLFVGGRVIPGRYPEAASSMLWQWREGKWVLDAENTKGLEKVELVSGAVWSDLDGDGKPELVLACEWGPIKVFHNAGGQLKEITKELGLDKFSGWWNGVTTGDLDGDGRMDIVASNWGLNSQYRTSRDHPRKIYYGDIDGNGRVEVIEGYYDEGMKAEVPERGLRAVGGALPWVKEKYPSYGAYGQASLREIYGEKLPQMGVLGVNTLASMVFLNRGDHFEAGALPAEAQWAPAFAVCVGDYDGDGKEDVFLSQNFFAMNAESSRSDAGRGLWLKGDGKGNLQAVRGQESGVKVYGEQRGAALCDYDGDGRVDLVVTQNGAETKLYHNVGARPGLRVRLRGPAGNPRGIGAQLRLMFGQRAGPLRELHAGSGYWSQDSAIEVLGTPEPPTAIQIHWPQGPIATVPIPPGAKEIEVDFSGKIKVLRQ